VENLAAKLSVVIRTRDKERYFHDLLANLRKQTIQASELVIVNNYSTEDRRSLFRNYLVEEVERFLNHRGTRVKLVDVADDEFSHAYSTNLGMVAAENELVCITNSHSLPISLHWLEDGRAHFEDGSVAGVSGFFTPHKEGTMIGEFDRKVYRLVQKAILRQNWCSTINCIIRKSLWSVYPFDENLLKIIPDTKKYGLEDYDWSREMRIRGYRIVIDPSFSVFHSHGNAASEISRNVRGYFVYREIQQRIDHLERPRNAFSRLFEPGTPSPSIESIV
jgi:glycosyltransferase involved in cell wall biosynthesis